ncbi:MAG: formate/nitrite transporter family protein [Chloroflexi bacterium]|nr:formate/nitrite transporter family protein [Chloroflexota bacterium]
MKQDFQLYPSIVETISEASHAAETKCRLSLSQGVVLGMIAAAYLALATTLALALGATIVSPSVQKLVQGAVFPVGLIAVVIAVSELSTGNYLVTPLGAMTGCVHWRHVLYNWGVSYTGNFLGSFALAAVIIYGAHVFTGAMWGQQWVDHLTKTVLTKASLSPFEAFWRGVLCIWLVDLAIWQAYRVKEIVAKFLLIWFPTFAFFALGLEHSVVNMFLFPAAIFAGAPISWSHFLLNNLTPVVLGNIVGGTFIVGMLYWFSAGLPVRKAESNPGPGGNSGTGSFPLLAANFAKGGVVMLIFFGLFPAAAAGLGLLLPKQWGIGVPLAVMGYLALAAFALSRMGRHRLVE